MIKSCVATFFIVVISCLVSAPTALNILEIKFDTTVFYNITEEENKEQKSLQEIDLNFLKTKGTSFSFAPVFHNTHTFFYINRYASRVKKHHVPPPEQV